MLSNFGCQINSSNVIARVECLPRKMLGSTCHPYMCRHAKRHIKKIHLVRNVVVFYVQTKELERRCLIHVANNKISVHELYKEFARWLIKENDELRKLCIYKNDWQLSPLRAGGSWSKVQRVRAFAV